MPRPLISIVTVVLNNRQGLRRTEESISRQTCHTYEWIVVDGGSQDGSLEVVMRSTVESLKWISEPDQGIYDAMNKGIKISSGEYVLFLNSGDELADERVIDNVLRLVSLILSQENSKSVVMGGVNRILPGGHKMYMAPRPASYIWHSLPASHQSMLFPLGFLRSCRYDTSYKICGDYYIGAQAYALGLRFISADFPISNFEVGGLSSQHSTKLVREAMQVQRTVLGLDSFKIVVSALYRMVNIFGARVLAVVSSLFQRK